MEPVLLGAAVKEERFLQTWKSSQVQEAQPGQSGIFRTSEENAAGGMQELEQGPQVACKLFIYITYDTLPRKAIFQKRKINNFSDRKKQKEHS